MRQIRTESLLLYELLHSSTLGPQLLPRFVLLLLFLQCDTWLLPGNMHKYVLDL